MSELFSIQLQNRQQSRDGVWLEMCIRDRERPGKRAVYVGLFRYQRPFDESRLHWGDCFPEKGLSLIHISSPGRYRSMISCRTVSTSALRF